IDNGNGIETTIEDQLFEPFFTTGTSGTGLGLYLAKELCEGNGGSLEYLRPEQGGSCFRIKLPLAA
ncbi:MAG TPA: two-component sensor histidine kinase, partial [Gammaproteobacteria bacterium]|nr:two-component sensor histidine kinase [Gammaproteobacteria bacterium]